MRRRLLLPCVLSGASLACGGFDPAGLIASGPPRGAAPVEVPEPDVSVLSLQVHIPYSTLQSAVQDRLPELLVDQEIEPNDATRVHLVIRRPMAVAFGPSDGDLKMTVPLDLQADLVLKRAAARRERMGKDPPRGATLTAGLELDLVTAYTLDADWKLVPDVTLTPRWTEPAVLAVGPLKLDITERVEEKLHEKLADTEAQIEARMAEQGDLRPRMDALWEGLATPRPLELSGQGSAPTATTLMAEPLALHATAPHAGPDGLDLDVGVTARFRVVTEVPELIELSALPAPTPPTAGGLHLSVVAETSWADLENRARGTVTELSWPLSVDGVAEAGTLEIDDLHLYPSGEHLVVGLDYRTESPVWETAGTLYLQAIPRLGDDRTVVLEDFDFSVESDDWATAPVNAELLRARVREHVRERLVLPYGDELDARMAGMNASLASYELARGGTFSGELSGITVQDVFLTDAGLGVLATFTGSGSVTLTSLGR
ncbi:MAG: DUF4403 family protein [Myxococcota bacterium]